MLIPNFAFINLKYECVNVVVHKLGKKVINIKTNLYILIAKQ